MFPENVPKNASVDGFMDSVGSWDKLGEVTGKIQVERRDVGLNGAF